MLTRMHYRSIAKVVRGCYVFPEGQISKAALISRLSCYFASDNARFDPDKFVKACHDRKGGPQNGDEG